MDEKRLRKLAGLTENKEEVLEEAAANPTLILLGMTDISAEFKRKRVGVRDQLRKMIKKQPREAKIVEDFLNELMNKIFVPGED